LDSWERQTNGVKDANNNNESFLNQERQSSKRDNNNGNGNGDQTLSSVPGWFPYTPTRRQIESLKVIELRDACSERGLQKGGNKRDLQKKLIEWTNSQHRRRVLERNAMRTQSYADSPLQGAIHDALFHSSNSMEQKHKQKENQKDKRNQN